MKKNLTELVMILDRSGSMGGLESDTVGGFNAMIEKQKQQTGEVVLTTILFDDHIELLHDRFPLKAVKKLTSKDYYVRGCTALNDAVGNAINKTVKVQKNLPKNERAEKVIFVITTDGMENASTEYSTNMIKKMIQLETEKYGWEFIYLGANMDAVSEAGKLGIREDRSVRYKCDSKGITKNYECVSETVCRMRASADRISGEWKQEIEEDYKERELKANKKHNW